MELTEACAMFTALTRLPASVILREADLEEVCQRARFHKTKSSLSAEKVGEALSSLSELESLSLTDHLQIHLLAGVVLGETIVVGPFCCEALSTMDAHALLHRVKLPLHWDQDLLAFTSSFPVLPEKEAIRLFRNFMAFESKAPLLPETVLRNDLAPIDQEMEEFLEKPYASLVEERYANEGRLMQAIREGNASEALESWRTLHQRVEFMREKVGHTKENYRNSATITRTVIRLAAMEVGVPPVILDEVTGDIQRKNHGAKTVDEILSNTELLIRRICAEVQRLHQDSYLVQKVKHVILSHYAEDLKIEEVSRYLGHSPSRLIERFRKETGTTPGAYLRQVRMEKAAQELTMTGKSIQEIAISVGIPDAGYFTRLFRQAYGQTPREYRKGEVAQKE